MSVAPRRGRPAAVALFLSLFLVAPVVEAAPALAAPAGPSRAAAGPSSNALDVIGGLVARLLPGLSPAAPGVPSAFVSQITASTVRVTLDKVGGHWLISGFDPI